MPVPGPLEILLILAIALIILGPKRLPEFGSSVGKTLREFRKAVSDVQDSTDIDPKAPQPNELNQAAVPNAVTPPATTTSTTPSAAVSSTPAASSPAEPPKPGA